MAESLADPAPAAVARAPAAVLPVVLRSAPALRSRVRYVFDTLFMAAGIPVRYVDAPPDAGPWISYGPQSAEGPGAERSLSILHCPDAWRRFEASRPAEAAVWHRDLPVVIGRTGPGFEERSGIGFDLAANAFYFLSSWAERLPAARAGRQLYGSSEFVRLGVPQDIVDRYLARLLEGLRRQCARLGVPVWPALVWPGGRSFAVVLSHDVDYLPVGRLDNARQGLRSVLRHLLRQREPATAWRAARNLAHAWGAGRDPYGCVPEIIEREQALGVRSSFQVAVGHRHPADVNYHVENDAVRDYLRAIPAAGFDLCLHGSIRSTENPHWYVEEAELLASRLGRPRGSRQHYLCFDYDQLFEAQERAGIRYDMSLGFPDRTGPRAGCSFPYFPYNLREDRPFRVLQIGLFLMDVTLQSYMRLSPQQARPVVDDCLQGLARARGCASVVWHPIVFAGARDPGYDALYWGMVERIGALGGLATDGRTVDAFWRAGASRYPSFC